MTVAERAPLLNSCILRTMSSFEAPARLGTSPTLTPDVPWQFAHVAARLRPTFVAGVCAKDVLVHVDATINANSIVRTFSSRGWPRLRPLSINRLCRIDASFGLKVRARLL